MILGLNVDGVFKPDERRPLETVVIKTTTVQDMIVRSEIEKTAASQVGYNLITNNCAIAVQRILASAWIITPETKFPNDLMKNLTQQFPQK